MLFLLAHLTAAALFTTDASASSREAVIHDFQADYDGFGPRAGLVADSAGDLYGTTMWGGGPPGAGIVYRLSPPSSPSGAWTESVIHRFSYHAIPLGLSPWGGLAIDRAGDLYGTAWLGGTCGDCGLVFELSTASNGKWRFRVIHNFQANGFDGINPQADLSIDANGDLFGTTASGGTGACFGGCGTVFELQRSGSGWIETVLHSFPAHGSGDSASGGTGGDVVPDAAGNVYGTTYIDGGLGTVFELVRPTGHGSWHYRVLYAFQNFADGISPYAGVTLDDRGDLFGTTNDGGVQGCYGSGCGTIFELTPAGNGTWLHTVLYDFRGTGDGGTPQASLTADSNGDVYGTTQLWGAGNGCPVSGCGVAFRLAASAGRGALTSYSVLHTFLNHGDGFVPYGALIWGPGKLLYGATEFGGKTSCSSGFGCGTVYSLIP